MSGLPVTENTKSLHRHKRMAGKHDVETWIMWIRNSIGSELFSVDCFASAFSSGDHRPRPTKYDMWKEPKVGAQ